MKRILIIIALSMAAPSLVFVQTGGRTSAQGGDVEQTLMRIEQELIDAVLAGDASAVERHYADSFIFTTPDGTMVNKSQVIANVKSGNLKYESTKIDDMKVQVYGDTAVVTLRSTDKGRHKGVDISGQYRWTDVFVRRDGRWQLVAAQGTRIAAQP